MLSNSINSNQFNRETVTPDFLKASMKEKIALKEVIPKLLGENAYLVTTHCVVKEIKNKGEEFLDEHIFSKNLTRIACNHFPHISSIECILSLAKKKELKFMVCLSREEEKIKIRQFGGIPIFYLKDKTVRMEKPSGTSKAINERILEKRMSVSEKEEPFLVKSEVKEEARVKPFVKKVSRDKKKRIKWLNKLQLKKKRKLEEKNGDTPKNEENDGDNARSTEETEAPKKKRRRTRKKKSESESVNESNMNQNQAREFNQSNQTNQNVEIN